MNTVIDATTAFTPAVTPTVFDTFVENFATENSLDTETAAKLVDWLGEVGVLDYGEIDNVYRD